MKQSENGKNPAVAIFRPLEGIAPPIRRPMVYLSILSAFFLIASLPAQTLQTLSPEIPELTPIFRSSFEDGVSVVRHDRDTAAFTGTDGTVKSPNDFDRLNPPYLTKFNIQYLGGDLSQRSASIVADPENETNCVLRFRVTDPGDQNRSRIQAQTNTETGYREIRCTYRMRLGDGWLTLSNLPDHSGWFIISEFWNRPHWTQHPYPFRAHFTLTNRQPGADPGIYVGVLSETIPYEGKKERLWISKNLDVRLPIGEWFDVEIYIKEGGADTGRYVLNIRTKDEAVRTVFDATGFTHHPDNPDPRGIRHFHPMKLYTGKDTAEAAIAGEGALEIFYDDFALYGKPVESDMAKHDEFQIPAFP